MTAAARILDYVERNPTATNGAIAEAVGVSRPYVTQVLQRAGVISSGVPPIAMRHTLAKNPCLFRWLRNSKPRGVSYEDWIAAILVDQMYGAKA